ncbi:hypothetical protein G8770_04980 [Aestuariicella hydrocarbonica]|uniref:Uncharacterized protein n=1 Tax=Pseudomaricurvus hydrocarbonicus TaxID=1470433 RepID=A0A9E5JYY3_9GAMM|nr:hypothetical protein [Aestuariicella hydrocarbonica]NHO64892.1 hypothetical protein [Aestuariicella hydrocarbonica]
MVRTFTLAKLLSVIACLSFLSLNAQALPASAEQQLNTYIKTFEGNNKTAQIQIAQQLEWAGYNQPRLFDIIETKLLADFSSATHKTDVDHLSWLSKALAFSGNEKYRKTLTLVADEAKSKKLRKYSQQAVELLPLQSRLTPQILNSSHWNEQWDLETNRIAAMFNSQDLELKRLAAKRVHYSHNYNPEILNRFQQALEQNYKLNPKNALFTDTWAWVCKALAGSRQQQYKATVTAVANNAADKKLKKYAQKYLRYFDKPL